MGILRKDKDRDREGKTVFHTIEREGNLWKFLQECLAAYRERTRLMSKPPIGETSIDQKLEAIIDVLRPLGGVPAQQKLDSERLETIHRLVFELGSPPSQPKLKGRFTLILKNNQPDFGYDFDVSGVTDEEGEQITDPVVLGAVVKEVASDNEGVVSATPPDEGGAGTIHVGTSGSATLTGKAWLNQADKDAGKDPAFVAAEPFTITTGDPAAITEGAFKFDIESSGTPAVEPPTT
jgi:hypothetical protein